MKKILIVLFLLPIFLAAQNAPNYIQLEDMQMQCAVAHVDSAGRIYTCNYKGSRFYTGDTISIPKFIKAIHKLTPLFDTIPRYKWLPADWKPFPFNIKYYLDTVIIKTEDDYSLLKNRLYEK